MKEWKDANTGCRVRQLTEFEEGVHRSYFRVPCALRDGRVVVRRTGGNEMGLGLVDIETGEVEPGPKGVGNYLTLQPGTGRCWFLREEEIWLADFSEGTEEPVCRLPENLKGGPTSITCDGLLAFGAYGNPPKGQLANDPDFARRFMHDFPLLDGGHLWTLDLRTGEVNEIHEFHEGSPGHLECSPTDPTLLRFCHEGPWHRLQRIWLIRTDGSDCHPVRVQQPGEACGHEFWWPGGNAIGYKYVDRRGDPTADEVPLLEYCSRPLRVGIASLDGKEQWLSEPLEHYQSHIIVSPDERWFCGEGTHDWFFVTVARRLPGSRRLEFKPVATTHAPYHPAAGAGIEASFSADSRWVIYNDEVEEVRQVYAVEVPEDWG